MNSVGGTRYSSCMHVHTQKKVSTPPGLRKLSAKEPPSKALDVEQVLLQILPGNRPTQKVATTIGERCKLCVGARSSSLKLFR